MINAIKSKILKLFHKLFSSKQYEKTTSFSNASNKLINNIKQNNIQEYDNSIQDLFKQTCPGDIVYAHMPLPEEVLRKIPEGHRTRPYYIAHKKDDGFIAYSLSSSPYESIPDTKTYNLSEIIYDGLAKSSYLDLYNSYFLPKEMLIKFICKTKINDYNEIQRRLWIDNVKDYEDLYKEKPVLSSPIPGDIINYDKRQWIIINEDIRSYSVFEISLNNTKTIRNGFYVHCNKDVWRVNFSKGGVIDKTSSIKTQHIVNRNDFINLRNQLEIIKKKNIKNKPKSNRTFKYFTKFNIGTVFKDFEENEEYVYLYSNKSYDYCIKVSEYLNSDVYPYYPPYETLARELTKNGEVADDELRQILLDQIYYGNDKCQILENKIKELQYS